MSEASRGGHEPSGPYRTVLLGHQRFALRRRQRLCSAWSNPSAVGTKDPLGANPRFLTFQFRRERSGFCPRSRRTSWQMLGRAYLAEPSRKLTALLPDLRETTAALLKGPEAGSTLDRLSPIRTHDPRLVCRAHKLAARQVSPLATKAPPHLLWKGSALLRRALKHAALAAALVIPTLAGVVVQAPAAHASGTATQFPTTSVTGDFVGMPGEASLVETHSSSTCGTG